MSIFAVDPNTFIDGDTDENGPIIPIVVSLTFPGMDKASLDLMQTTTEIAFEAVRKAGGKPKLIDSAAQHLTKNADVIENAGGVLFLGGGDVYGPLYGGPESPKNSYGVDRRADEYCISLIRDTIAQDLPLLAICRGSQLFNVAHGGTLIPDIEEYALHRGGPGEPLFLDEEVCFAPGSIVEKIYGKNKLVVRSGHHQAVDRVGDNLFTAAKAHDGIVEGTQHVSATWAIGIQWHPEDPHANVADRELLFESFIAQSKKRLMSK